MPYTITDDADCGSIVYNFSVPSGFDLFSSGLANANDNVITFSNLSAYEVGLIDVQMEVSSTLKLSAAYTINFEMEVIDCYSEIMTSPNPPLTSLAVTFPFDEKLHWSPFEYM